MAKFTCFSIIVFFIILLQFSYEFSDFERTHGYAVKINRRYSRLIKTVLQKNHFTLWYEITPETYIVVYTSLEGIGDEVLKKLSEKHPNTLLLWEQLKVYTDKLKPANSGFYNYPQSPNLVCAYYYGFGVESVWKQGISGKGVTIGVTDIGVDTDLVDLKENIVTRENISYNFIDNTAESVKPERFLFNVSRTAINTDHGNSVSSVIAAVKGNDVCSAGIAFNAKIAVLKIFKVEYVTDFPYYTINTAADVTARALKHDIDTIDIFVNAWNSDDKFQQLDLPTAEAIDRGATKGREGRGTIYLFPTSPPGHGHSNNINTITVGSIGRFGNTVEKQHVDASVISSVLYQGNNLTASSIVTTSHENRCISTFRGYSAATAMMGGAIALALEANPYLSRRDTMHLLVEASSRKGLQESKNFRKNGAGRYFHDMFGFGLLDVRKLVELAKDGRFTGTLWCITLKNEVTRKGKQFLEAEFCNDCQNLKRDKCVTKVEHIELTVDIETDNSYLKIVVISPSNTESVVIDTSLSEDQGVANVKRQMKFVSTHFWGERPLGKWKVEVRKRNDREFILKSLNITIYGEHTVESSAEIQTFTCLSTKLGPFTSTGNVKITTTEKMRRQENFNDSYFEILLISALVILIAVFIVVAKMKIGNNTIIQTNNNNNNNNINNASVLPNCDQITEMEILTSAPDTLEPPNACKINLTDSTSQLNNTDEEEDPL